MRKWFFSFLGADGDRTSTGLYRLFQVAVFLFLIVLTANFFLSDLSRPGEWGDFFGGVLNPILTFITFMGLLVTITLQQNELKESRIQFEKSARALESQDKTLRDSQEKDMFFRLLENFNRMADSVDIHPIKEGPRLTGRDCFSFFYTELSRTYKDKSRKHNQKYADQDILNWSFDLFIKKYEQDLSAYLKQVEAVTVFISESGNSQEYSKILRSNLSSRENLLVFYYTITHQGEFLTSFSEAHGFFEGIEKEYLLSSNHISFIRDSAYGVLGPKSKSVRQPPGLK